MGTILISCSWWGGGLSVPVYFKALADRLVARGHRVIVTVTGGQRQPVPDAAGTEVYFWPDGRGTTGRDLGFIWRLLGDARPDLIIANFSAVNLLMILGSLRGVPLRLAYYHTLLEQVQADSGGLSPARRLRMARKSMIYRMATHLVAVSERAGQDLRRVYGVPDTKINVFHNAALDPFQGSAGRLAEGERFPWVVGAFRLDVSKGPDLLIDAVARLRREGRWPEGFEVRLFGDGPQAEACRRRIRDQRLEGVFRLPGRRPPAEVKEAMKRAAFSVLPSRSDNCPLAAIESLAAGTPVVGARAGGIPELVDGRCGALFQAGDADDLAKKMAPLLDDPDLRHRLGRQARERFEERFELHRSVARQADWLETLLVPK